MSSNKRLSISFCTPCLRPCSLRHMRESTLAKVSLGTLPQLTVPAANKSKKIVKDFRKALRAECHRSILNCYKAHNQAGGTIVPLQDGTSQYFPKAVILAIYADAPAAVDCTCTGSACPVCYMPKKYMSAPGTDQDDLRTDTNMLRRQAVLRNMVHPTPPRRRVVGASKNAQNRSSMFGIPMKDLTVWSSIKDPDEDWVFGPNRSKDNVYQSTPQVNLHGMDEGLVAKANFGALMTFITHVMATKPTWGKITVSSCDHDKKSTLWCLNATF